MKKKIRRVVIPILIACIALFMQFINSICASNVTPYAENGILNLDEWSKKRAFLLIGDLEFYWDRLLTIDQIRENNEPYEIEFIPWSWNHYEIDEESLPAEGKATFKVHVINADVNQQYGIRIENVSTAYKLYIDNILMSENGHLDDDENAQISDYQYSTIPFTPDSSEFDIIFQISNHVYPYGGLTSTIFLGTFEQINFLTNLMSDLNNIFFSIIVFICILFLIVYAAYRKENDLIILVGLGIIVILRLFIFPNSGLSFANMFPGMTISVLSRINYIANAWSPFMFVYYLYVAYSGYVKKLFVIISFIYSALTTIFCMVFPFAAVSFSENFIYLILYIAIIYSTIQLAIASWRNEEGAPFFFGVLAFYALYIIYYSVYLDFSISYYIIFSQSFALITLFMAQFINVAQRYSRAQRLEMSAYRNQIHPHFFNNSLAGIISVSRTDPTKSRELLLDMSSYLRGFYDYLDDDLITLNQELELIKAYVTLNNMRFGNHVKVTYSLEVSNIMLPPLILEPLVENAFIHGLPLKEEGDEIMIYSKRNKSGKIQIGVKDNGVGLDESKKQSDSRQGVGIKNINLRLKKLYRTQLVYESPAEGGCNVYMEIPLKEAPIDESVSSRQ